MEEADEVAVEFAIAVVIDVVLVVVVVVVVVVEIFINSSDSSVLFNIFGAEINEMSSTMSEPIPDLSVNFTV